MRIAWEEPFGPVLPVIRIKTVEEGIHHCNANNFALQVCIFSFQHLRGLGTCTVLRPIVTMLCWIIRCGESKSSALSVAHSRCCLETSVNIYGFCNGYLYSTCSLSYCLTFMSWHDLLSLLQCSLDQYNSMVFGYVGLRAASLPGILTRPSWSVMPWNLVQSRSMVHLLVDLITSPSRYAFISFGSLIIVEVMPDLWLKAHTHTLFHCSFIT